MNYFIAHAILYLLIMIPACTLLWIQNRKKNDNKTNTYR